MDRLDLAEDEFGKCLACRWIHNFLVRYADRVRPSIASPRKKPGLRIVQLFSAKCLVLIKEYIPLVPAELIVRVGECGFSHWEARMSKPVVILTGIRNSTFHYPVNRGIRHQTLICCITADVDVYRPLWVSSGPAVRQVFGQGVCEGIDLRIENAPSPCANAEIFDWYWDTVLISAIVPNRETEGSQDKLARLFYDKCVAHYSDNVLGKFARHGILILIYPPHISHLFQVLDILLLQRSSVPKDMNDEMICYQW
jgi:hypothetical protein